MQKHFLTNAKDNESFTVTEYRILDLPQNRDLIAKDIAEFFIGSWMKNAEKDMLALWRDWDNADQNDQALFRCYLGPALGTDSQELFDDPSQGQGWTLPLGVFAETMLRALRQHFCDDQILVFPPVPAPTGDGNIDFIEISGQEGSYASMKLTMWEIKGSDNQACGHNSEIYHQISAYPTRFFPIANQICEYYQGTDSDTKRFLRDMAGLAKSKSAKVHYGAFVAYDEKIKQLVSMVPKLHKRPLGHPNPVGAPCHHLNVLLIPDFRNMRLAVWRELKYIPKP